ncbi:MAG: hypothetical protein AB8C95_09830 [Phycisphaeraceae bacterium]
MAEQSEGHCERCRKFAVGRMRWMFYQPLERFPESPIVREFFCNRCIKIMRLYAVIGFTLVGIVVAGIAGVTIWAWMQA